MSLHSLWRRFLEVPPRMRVGPLVFACVLLVLAWGGGLHFLLGTTSAEETLFFEIVLDLLFVAVATGIFLLVRSNRQWLANLSRAGAGDAVGIDVVPASPRRAYRPDTQRSLPYVFMALLLVVPLLGVLYVSLEIPKIERETFSRLETFVQLTSEQVENWLEERQSDVEVFSANRLFAEEVSGLQQAPADKDLRSALRARLESLRQAKNYEEIALLDADGRILVGSIDWPQNSSAEISALIQRAAQRGKPLHSEMISVNDGDDDKHVIYFVAPIFVERGGQSALLGFVIVRSDVYRSVFYYLNQSPLASQTGLVTIARRSNGDVLYFDSLRDTVTPQTRRVPVKKTGLPVVRAVLDPAASAVMTKDAHDVSVLAAYRSIVGTDWHLVATVQRAEVMRPMWQTLFWIGGVALLALLSLLIALVSWWRQREQSQALLLQAEQARTDRVLHHFFDLPFVGMAILSAETRQFIRFNDLSCELSGYSREELLGKTAAELVHPEDLEQVFRKVLKVRSGETDEVVLEARMIRKDGAVIVIECDVKAVRRPDGSLDYLFVTAQDVTSRKMHEMALSIANAQLKISQAELREQNESLVRAQNALEESHRRYIGLYEFAPVAYLTLSTDGVIQGVNQTGANMFGLPRDTFFGRGFLSLVAAWDAARWSEFLALASKGEERHSEDFALRQANGSIFYARVESTLQFEAEARPVVRMTLTDISARRQAEMALRASFERYEAVLQSSHHAIVTVSSAGEIVSWNPSAERIFGYTATEIIGQPLERLIPARMRNGFRSGTARLLAGKHPESANPLELTGLRKDGSEIDIDLSLSRWEVAEGVFYTNSIRDISERKRTEQTLRMLSEAIRQSPEAVVITDAYGRIEFVNEAFSRHTGYAPEEVIGQNPRILQSGNTPADAYVKMWEALTRGESWKGEFHNARKDGSEFVEFAVVAPIRQADGRISHYVAVKEDVSEKKRLGLELDSYRFNLEEIVRQRTAQLAEARVQAEAANVAKSAFLANMSHEIRTPMNAIIGLIHLMRNTELTPRQVERLDKVDNAAAHLLALINNILDLSKIESGKMELEETDFVLNTVVDNVQSMIANQAREKNLDIHVDLDSVPLWLRGDPTRLCQALLNYASNAVKFTHRGKITLRTRLLEENEHGLHMRFEVEDTGVGVDREKIPGLFTAFEQADTSTTRMFGGTGLGLAITLRLAFMMGGDVGVESERQRGSTFWFTAWLKRGQGIVPSVTEELSGDDDEFLLRQYAGARVLLVDDVAVNLEVAELLLASVGLSVDLAHNGREAVDKAGALAYDLVLMDVQMPEMNGLDATRAIRQLPAYAQTPILAMTANAFDEDRHVCLAAGMNDFISKPVDPEVLYAILLRWLSVRKAAGVTAINEGKDLVMDENVVGCPAPAPAPTTATAPLMPPANLQRQRLEGVPGLDYENGLARVRGNEEKFNHVVALFLQGHAGDSEKLATAYAQQDLTAIEHLAHSLKGSAGLIGATQVAALSTALLEAIRSGGAPDEVSTCFSQLEPSLTELLDGIGRAQQEQAGDSSADSAAGSAKLAAASSADIGRCRDVLAHLEYLLESGDMAACQLAEDEQSCLASVLGESGAPLLSAIRTFDFERALSLLHPLRETLAAEALA